MNTDLENWNTTWKTDLPVEIIDVAKHNRNFKILLLYALRTLNNDMKQEIIKKLLNTAILYEYIFFENLFFDY